MNLFQRCFALLMPLTTLCCPLAAQDVGQDYAEPLNPVQADPSVWRQIDARLHASWAARDVHYAQERVPAITLKSDTVLYAWRGERVGMQALLFSPRATQPLRLRLRLGARPDGTTLDAEARAQFVNYVLTDEKRGCGKNDYSSPTRLVPDVLDTAPAKALAARTTRPVWCSFEIARTAQPGRYPVTLDVVDAATGKTVQQLSLQIHITEQQLPAPKDYQFHIDFWQQPYAVSRVHNVPRWSEAHYEALRPYLRQLARSGQSVVSAILFYEPWGEQSQDKFDAMIRTVRKADGSWSYDYTVFDRYVELCAECGIDEQINCYSMIPWDMAFTYYDEAQGKDVVLKTKTSEPAYAELWTPFLKAFAEHLRAKGWYDKTCIAMDERPLEDMINAYNVLQAAVPGMKMALAGNYHADLTDKLYDYCIALHQSFPAEILQARNAKGWISTTYVACPDLAPNLCTYNAPSEAAYIPLYCVANGFNGMLRWSWMNWNETPLTDSRFKLFPAGDTYLVYPGGRSSLRYERFLEGVQQVEKLRILKEQWKAEGRTAEWAAVEKALDKFRSGNLDGADTAARLVNTIESLLNGAPHTSGVTP